MAFLHLAPLAYEAGGVQQLLHNVTAQRRETIFNVSDRLENRFADRLPRPRIVTSPRWSHGLRLPLELSMRWHARQHQGALVWDDISTWRQIARHHPDAILYDHGVSARNHGQSAIAAVWRRVRQVIACSAAQADHIRSSWDTDAHIAVCLNGLPRDFPVPAERPVRPGIAGRRIRLGMVARLSFEKGHGVMLHALKLLRAMGVDAELVIVGAGALDRALAALIDTLDLGPNVTMSGYVDTPSHIYRDLDVVCLPSLWEAFGLTAIEAGAFGCPVVAANRGGLAEAVGEGGILVEPTCSLQAYRELAPSFADDQWRTRLGMTAANDEVCALDPAQLADAIARVVSCGETYENLSLAGFRQASAQFSFETYMRRLGGILEGTGPARAGADALKRA